MLRDLLVKDTTAATSQRVKGFHHGRQGEPHPVQSRSHGVGAKPEQWPHHSWMGQPPADERLQITAGLQTAAGHGPIGGLLSLPIHLLDQPLPILPRTRWKISRARC